MARGLVYLLLLAIIGVTNGVPSPQENPTQPSNSPDMGSNVASMKAPEAMGSPTTMPSANDASQVYADSEDDFEADQFFSPWGGRRWHGGFGRFGRMGGFGGFGRFGGFGFRRHFPFFGHGFGHRGRFHGWDQEDDVESHEPQHVKREEAIHEGGDGDFEEEQFIRRPIFWRPRPLIWRTRPIIYRRPLWTISRRPFYLHDEEEDATKEHLQKRQELPSDQDDMSASSEDDFETEQYNRRYGYPRPYYGGNPSYNRRPYYGNPYYRRPDSYRHYRRDLDQDNAQEPADSMQTEQMNQAQWSSSRDFARNSMRERCASITNFGEYRRAGCERAFGSQRFLQHTRGGVQGTMS